MGKFIWLKRKLFLLYFLLVFLFNIISVHSQSELEDIDKELKKELGQPKTEEQKTKSGKKKIREKENKQEEISPLEERFERRKAEEESTIWILIKIILVFSILTAAMYYILKYIAKNRNAKFPAQSSMKVLASLPLATSKQLQIVDVSGMLLLIGVSDDSVNLIMEINDSNIKNHIYQLQQSYEPPITENFLELALKSFKNFHFGFPSQDPSQDMQNKENPKNYGRDEDEIVDEIKMRQMEILEKIKKERKNLSKS